MESDATLLVGSHHLSLLLQTAYNTVYCIEEILFAHSLLVVACSNEGCLVTNVGNICTRETWSLACQEINIYSFVNLDRFEMYQEDSLTFVQTREIYVNFAVETSGTEQGAVEHVYTVGSCKDDDTTVGAETIHLCKESVQGVLALIITTHGWVLAAGTAYSINLIDKDDTR